MNGFYIDLRQIMRRNTFSLFVFIFMQSSLSFAQKDNVWIFKTDNYYTKSPSLDFHSEPPNLKKINENAIDKIDKYISVTDDKGDLLFYNACSSYLFDTRGLKMPNSLILHDSMTSLVTFAIVQIDTYRYFLFYPYTYIDKLNPYLRKTTLYASIIDLRLNNGYGDIDSNYKIKEVYRFNSEILQPTDVYQINKFKNWYLLRNDSFFYAFRINNDNIDLPVITKVSEYNSDYHCCGGTLLRFSHDGNNIIFSGQTKTGFTYLYIYDFDLNSGKTSNMQIMDSINSTYYSFFGGTFSPNDSFILVSVGFGNVPLFSQEYYLNQYKRYSKNYTQEVYKYKLNSEYGPPGYIKLGPNSRVYCFSFSWNKHIQIIYPDSFKNIKVHLIDKSTNFNRITSNISAISNKFRRVSFKIYTDTCHNHLRLKNFSHPDYIKFNWYVYKDSILVDSFNTENAKIAYSGTWAYYIKIKATDSNGYYAWYSDTIQYSDKYSKVKSDFEADTNVWCANLKLLFKDKSYSQVINPKKSESWQWNFGDNETSFLKNPEHIYSNSGIYPVKLIYSNGYCFDTLEKKNEITIIEAPRPGFKLSQTNYCSPYTLQITDTSLGKVKSWHYDFGDGTSDSTFSPSHLFSSSGTYKIVQTLTGPTGCVTKDSAILHLRKGFSGTETVNALTASVDSNRSILFQWQSIPEAFGYHIFKSDNEVSFYKLYTQNDTFYQDFKVKPTEQVHTYKITAHDSCSRSTADSRVMKNILLTGKAEANEYSILNWTPYEIWQKGVKEYVLEYLKDTTFVTLTTTLQRNYTDNEFFTGERETEKCYRIKAIENGGNQQQSLSNVLCLAYQPALWFPTAFTPNGDGLNDTFALQGISIKEFNMQIFNRWGEKVFESNSLYDGWNGKFRGNLCPPEVYTVIIKARKQNGQSVFYSGAVLLVR